MLRRLLDFQLSFFERKKKLSFFRPLARAADSFFYEVPESAKKAPFIRDSIDIKRWMVLVVLALLPCMLSAIWNTGLQKAVYGSGDFVFMDEYLRASETFRGYFDFVLKDMRYWLFLKEGLLTFLPVLAISYAAGGFAEALFAYFRNHEIAEGFLVTGLLYPLILPPTLPYWMVALGVIFGVVVGKELFGGTGMNILNPALTARAFLFFTFPGKMTGDVWAGSNPSHIAKSLAKMNMDAGLGGVDGYTQATPLQGLNNSIDAIKRIHVEAIASNSMGSKHAHFDLIKNVYQNWQQHTHLKYEEFGQLSLDQLQAFVTAPIEQGGLGLHPANFPSAYMAAESIFGIGKFSDGNLFFGNILGSMGETSTFACCLGALFLIYTGIGAWRTMAAFGVGAFATGILFEWISTFFGGESGLWTTARFAMPAYRHLLMGGLAFGLVFMATDPVSSPTMKGAKWIYGLLIGSLTIIIRLINPAYPEGVMLAILFGNVFAPLIDHLAVQSFRQKALKLRKRVYG